MKDHRRNEIKVGLTVLFGLLLLLFGVASFKNWTLGTSDYQLTIRFPTSASLQMGDEVSVNGVRAGRVESVMLDRNTVLVRARIQTEYPLRQDATARIQMLELMGGKKIELQQGTSEAPFDLNMVMNGSVDPDIAGALGMVGNFEGDVKRISGKTTELLDNVNNVVGDREFITSLKEAVENLRVISSEVRQLVSANRSNANTIADNVVKLTNRVDTLLTETRPFINSALRKSDHAITSADSLMSEVHSLVTEIRESKGLVSRLLHDQALSRRLDTMLTRVDSLTSIIINGEFVTRVKLW